MRQSKQSDEHTIAFNMFWSIWVLSDRATTELAGCQAAHKQPRVIQSPIAAVDPKLKPGKQFDEIPVGASSLFGLTMTPWLTKNEDSWLIARTHLDCNTSPIYIYVFFLLIKSLHYHTTYRSPLRLLAPSIVLGRLHRSGPAQGTGRCSQLDHRAPLLRRSRRSGPRVGAAAAAESWNTEKWKGARGIRPWF